MRASGQIIKEDNPVPEGRHVYVATQFIEIGVVLGVRGQPYMVHENEPPIAAPVPRAGSKDPLYPLRLFRDLAGRTRQELGYNQDTGICTTVKIEGELGRS